MDGKLAAVSLDCNRNVQIENDIKSHFLLKRSNGTYGEETAEKFSCALVEGKFLVFETKDSVPKIATFVIKDVGLLTPIHSVVAEKLLSSDLVFVGGGHIRWSAKDYVKNLPQSAQNSIDYRREVFVNRKPYLSFGSESCLAVFGYDRPEDESKQQELLEWISKTIVLVRDESFCCH